MRKVDNAKCKVLSLIVDADTEGCVFASLDISVEITHRCLLRENNLLKNLDVQLRKSYSIKNIINLSKLISFLYSQLSFLLTLEILHL